MKSFFGFFLLIILVAAVFEPARSFDFLNFDDDFFVTENPAVRGGLSWAAARWSLSATAGGNWQPLVWLSHMTMVEFFGLSPGAHHLCNALVHALSTGLLFLLLLRATGNAAAAWVTAALFGVHPLRIESVVWVSERGDVLSLFFSLLTALLYVRFARGPSVLRYLPVVLTFVLGLFCKSSVVTVPVLLLLLDYWPLRRAESFRRLVVEKIPLFILSLCGAAIALYSQRSGGGARALSEVSLFGRFAEASTGYATYLGKLFWPVNLGIFYPRQPHALWIVAVSVLLLAAITVLVIRAGKQHRYLPFGWAWFIIALLPMSGIVAIGGQSVADRWTYLPHAGLLIAIVWYFSNTFRGKTVLLSTVSVGALLTAIVITRENLPNWKDSESIFSHTLKVSPNNFMAHTNLGVALAAGGRMSEAAFHYEEAVRLNPTYPEALNNLGTLRAFQGRYAEAAALFERAVRIRGDFPAAKRNLEFARADLRAAELGH